MANKFNWSKECILDKDGNPTPRGAALLDTYKRIWFSLLGKTDSTQKAFNAFLQECRQPGANIDGEAFNKKLAGCMRELHAEELKTKQDAAEAKVKEEAEADAKAGKPWSEEALAKAIKKARQKAEGKVFSQAAKEAIESSKTPLTSSINPTQEEIDLHRAEALKEAYLISIQADGYVPYDTVLTAAYEVACGMNLQMECGGGKTGVLFMASYVQAKVDGKQDYLTSSTSDLAKQSFDETIQKYDIGGIQEVSYVSQEKIVMPEFKNGEPVRDGDGKLVLKTYTLAEVGPEKFAEIAKTAHSQKIVLADNASVMQHDMAGYIPEDSPAGQRNLLADEADYVLQDQYQAAEQLGDVLPPDVAVENGKYREIAQMLMDQIKAAHSEASPLYIANDKSQYVDFTPAGDQFIASKITTLASKFPNIDKQQIADYTYDALVAETLYKENREFQFQTDHSTGESKIVSVHRASGTAIDLPQGIEQALYYKYKNSRENLKKPQERQVLKSITVASVYDKRFGRQRQSISGTLGIEARTKVQQEELARFGLTEENTYDGSPRKGNALKRAPIQVMRTRKELMDFCIDEAIRTANGAVPEGLAMAEGEQSGPRPALLNVDAPEDVKAAAEEIRKRDSSLRVLEYTATSENEFQHEKEVAKSSPAEAEKFKKKYGVAHTDERCADFQTYIKKCAGNGKTVIVGNGIIGRGTNVGLADGINELGGIHVVIAGTRDTSSRDPKQIEKRAARGSDNGSVRETICLEDMPDDLRAAYESGEITAEQLKESFYERVDERQSIVRTNTYELDKSLQENMKTMTNALELAGVPQERITEACALLTERARVIQFRAEGNTDMARHAAYREQISTFADLYTSKYRSNNPAEFGDKDWLAERNPDMAATYMEFTEAKKQMIIEHYQGRSLSPEKVKNMVMSSQLDLGQVKEILGMMQPQGAKTQEAGKGQMGGQ